MKKLKANQPLTGDYGHVEPGESFFTTDEIAKSLVDRELAEELEFDESELKTDADADDSDDKSDKDAAGRKTKGKGAIITDNVA